MQHFLSFSPDISDRLLASRSFFFPLSSPQLLLHRVLEARGLSHTPVIRISTLSSARVQQGFTTTSTAISTRRLGTACLRASQQLDSHCSLSVPWFPQHAPPVTEAKRLALSFFERSGCGLRIELSSIVLSLAC